MKIDEILKSEIDEDMERIETPTSLYEFARNIKEESIMKDINVTPIVKKKSKKKFQFAAAAVVGFGLLTGSAFLNPTMAEMASKIPYLGQVFKQKPLMETITEALEKEGYKYASVGMTPGDKVEFSVMLDASKEQVVKDKGKITNIIKDILKRRGYDQYKITVSADTRNQTPVPETEEEKKMTVLGEKLQESLKKEGYDIIVVNPFNSKIEVSIPLTEKRVDEIKMKTLEITKENGSDKEVTMDIIDVENTKRENTWTNYFNSIHEGLALKKEYHVTGYGYSYRPAKVKFFLKTSLNASDKNTKATVEKIRKEIDAFLSTEEVKSEVNNQPYELIIRGKGGKVLPY